MITKSGTNQFHGTAFEFFRNTVLNANDFFRNRTCGFNAASLARQRAGGVKLALNQNQFGGVIGGPIKKDKLFFFTSYQQTVPEERIRLAGLRQHQPAGACRSGPRRTAVRAFRGCPRHTAVLLIGPTSAGGTQVACDGSTSIRSP